MAATDGADYDGHMDLVQLGSLAVGVGGLAVAALAVYLNRHERTAPYRERLYDKLMEAAFDLHPKVEALTHVVMNAEPGALEAEPGCTVDADARRRIGEAATDEYMAFQSAWARWWLVLPWKVIDALADYDLAVQALIDPDSIRHHPNVAATPHPITQVVRANGLVHHTIREVMGTDPLGDAARRLMYAGRDDPMTAQLTALIRAGKDWDD